MSNLPYKVIKACSTESLETLVSAFMINGYRPIGSMFSQQTEWYDYDNNTENKWTYYQSMMYDKKVPKPTSLVRFLSIDEVDSDHR